MRRLVTKLVGAACALLLMSGAQAAETPKRGGIFIIDIVSEPNTYDCHGALSTQLLQFLSQHYSLLVKYDTDHWPKIIGDRRNPGPRRRMD